MILFSFNYDVPFYLPIQYVCIDKIDKRFLLLIKSHVEIYPVDYKKNYINKCKYEYEEGEDLDPVGVLEEDYEFPEEINGHKFSHWDVDSDLSFKDDEWLRVFSEELQPTTIPTDFISKPELFITEKTSDDEIILFLNQWNQEDFRNGVHNLYSYDDFTVEEKLKEIKDMIK